MVGDDGKQWGEIYDNKTGIGILGNVFQDRADLGISKTKYSIYTYLATLRKICMMHL